MDMPVEDDGSLGQRLRSPAGFTATANYFVMDWAAVARDIFGGLLIAGACRVGAGLVLAALLPRAPLHTREVLGAARRPGGRDHQLRLLDRQRAARGGALERRHQLRRRPGLHLRRPDHPAHPRHLPPLLRLEDGWFPARQLLRDDGHRRARGRVPLPSTRDRAARPQCQGRDASVSWNYTTYLNIAFLLLAASLVWRYFRYGGGVSMLRMMNKPWAKPPRARWCARALGTRRVTDDRVKRHLAAAELHEKGARSHDERERYWRERDEHQCGELVRRASTARSSNSNATSLPPSGTD
jgi:hypothetical protein